MEYKVTCKNCGHQYRLTADGGQSVWSTCPNCGHKMLVSLPHADGGNSPAGNGYASNGIHNAQQPVEPQKKKNNKGVTILLAFILGIVIGIVAWFGWQQKQKNDQQALEEREEARKEHMDSLMALRNQQESEERAAQQTEADRRSVMTFLNEFYQDWFFGDGDPNRYANNISEKCYNKLTSSVDDEEESDSACEIDWALLGPQFESESDVRRDLPDFAGHFDITHYHDNWYKVCFSAHGTTEYRQIEAFVYKNKIIINDFR